MTETLPGMPMPDVNPMQHKLYPIVMDAAGELIDHAKWLRAHAEGKMVATCRRCGHYCKPLMPTETAGRFDYEAVCINEAASAQFPRGCGKSVMMPGGRVAVKSTRDRERPHRD